MEELHKETLRVYRAKNERHFLDPEWGVGVTSKRGKLMGPAWCQFCESGEYSCLGSACLGLKPAPRSVSVLDRCYRKGNIPGLNFKKTKAVGGHGIVARVPRGRRGAVFSTVFKVKKLGYTNSVGEGVNR